MAQAPNNVGKTARQVAQLIREPIAELPKIPAEVVPEYPQEAVPENPLAREFHLKGKGPWKREE